MTIIKTSLRSDPNPAPRQSTAATQPGSAGAYVGDSRDYVINRLTETVRAEARVAREASAGSSGPQRGEDATEVASASRGARP